MRARLLVLTLVPTLQACYTALPVPAELTVKSGSELRTITEGAVVECSDVIANAQQFWFGGHSKKDNLCLFPADYAKKETAIWPTKALVPTGTIYYVKGRRYWNGIDADRYFLEITVPSVTGDAPVILLDSFSQAPVGARIGSSGK